MGVYIGDYLKVMKRDTRSLDYSSDGSTGEVEEGAV